MRRGRGQWLAIGLGVALVATALAFLVRGPGVPPPPGTVRASGSPGTRDPGPVIFYEVLDAQAARLFARPLDGESQPREVAARFDADGPAWTVDPTGSIAVAATNDETAGPGLVALDPRTGGQLWTLPLKAPIDISSAVWAPDGTRLAAVLDDPDAASRAIALVDVRAGSARFPILPDDVTQLQGFAPDGGLILGRVSIDESTSIPSWTFLRVDPTAIPILELKDPPTVGPAGDGYAAAAPGAGIAIDQVAVEGKPGVSIRAWDLRTRTSRIVTTLPALDQISFDPRATGVIVTGSDAVRFVRLDGRASDVFTADVPIADVGWSTAGDYLVVTTDQPKSALTVVERATGRSVAIPTTGPIQFVRFVAMPGGIALPDAPLPASEPTPTPTPGPSGADVAGFSGVLAGWVDDSTGRYLVRAQRLVPTDGGGVRVAADMPPIDAGAVDPQDPGPPGVLLVARPGGSGDVLVWITTVDGSRGSLWTAAGAVEPLGLPADWPANTGDVAWRPDGGALAASASRPMRDGGFEPDFVIAAIGARRTTVIPVVGDYDRLDGWWSTSELRVGHGACFEGCPGTYAEFARLRIADRRLVELTPADRDRAAIDELTIDRQQLVLSATAGSPTDDLRIDWPEPLGPASSLTLVGAVADARDLVVARTLAGETELYRIPDVAGRAVNGVLADPDPVRIAAIAGRDLQVERSPDGAWALVTDRVNTTRLVRLSDGRAWAVDAGRVLTWAGG
ncbi:MAG TPA: hypothetical protein VFJ71_03305 [Candidatus Limnocylindrales bacterium]|nr:hypothetical protein [Candidatus Limnocylindrales bacterium]